MLKYLVHYRFLLLLSLVALMLSCTKQDSPECPATGDLPPVKGMVDLSIHVLGQQEIVPKTRHGESKPGTGDENKIETLLVMAFNQDGSAVETREEIKINNDGTATNVANGEPHQGWNVVTRKLRINMNEGTKKICVIANWPVSATASDEFPVIRNIATFDELNAIVRRHTPTIGMPTMPPIMCSMLEVDVTDRTTAIDVPLVRQIARVDIYTAMTPELKLSGVEIVLKGVQFRKLAGSSYLLAHTGTDGNPVSPTPNTLWGTTNFVMTDHTITSTDPTLESSPLYSTSYLPEHIAADETAASEMVLMVEYNGANSYYAVKLHNGLTDAEKRYWVERNHWYRYNLTITGKGSDNPDQPSHEGVKVGVSNLDWNDGGATTPGSEIELPVKSIEVMHFKGIARFQLTGRGADPKWNFPGRTFSVSTYNDWIVARKVEEGASDNVITWLEIMTRTFTGTGQREGEVIVMLDNGVQGRVKVKQLDEASSLWKNPNDKTTWYRANIGAARIEDPGFYYQWGRNVAYSPYTPVKSIAPDNQNPLHNYGTINWNDIPQIFPQETPSVSWEDDIILSANPRWPEETVPCPQGYQLPNTTMFVRLWANTGSQIIPGAYAGRIMVNGEPGYWFNGDKNITNVPSNLNLGVFFLDHGRRDYQTGATNEGTTYYWSVNNFRETSPPAACALFLDPTIISSAGIPDKTTGAFVRCVKMGNVLYESGAPDATGSMTDSRFYEVGEEVLPLASTYSHATSHQIGWDVISSRGEMLRSNIALTGETFSYPSDVDYIILRASWGYRATFDMNGATSPQIPPQVVKPGGRWTQPTPAPEATHFNFTGWDRLSGDYFDTPVTSNASFRARWYPKGYTCEYIWPDGSVETQVELYGMPWRRVEFYTWNDDYFVYFKYGTNGQETGKPATADCTFRPTFLDRKREYYVQGKLYTTQSTEYDETDYPYQPTPPVITGRSFFWWETEDGRKWDELSRSAYDTWGGTKFYARYAIDRQFFASHDHTIYKVSKEHLAVQEIQPRSEDKFDILASHIKGPKPTATVFAWEAMMEGYASVWRDEYTEFFGIIWSWEHSGGRWYQPRTDMPVATAEYSHRGGNQAHEGTYFLGDHHVEGQVPIPVWGFPRDDYAAHWSLIARKWGGNISEISTTAW